MLLSGRFSKVPAGFELRDDAGFHESAGASNNAAHSDRLVSERCHEACHLVS